ncbi:hypothetical protein T06_14596 [Trichinella sp. T6]|nr:hypothetical protein T06_14596 [Trichinella sp. T6]
MRSCETPFDVENAGVSIASNYGEREKSRPKTGINTRRTVPFKFIKCTGYKTRDRRFAKVLFFLCSLNLLGCFCRFALPTFSLLTYESVGVLYARDAQVRRPVKLV